MLDIIFTICFVLMYILCFVLVRRCRELKRQVDELTEYVKRKDD